MQGVRAGLGDDRQGELLRRDHRGRFVDQGADGRVPRRTDDAGAGDQCAEPVRQVDHLLAGDAREEVLVAAGEADHLVREDRADDQRDIVLDDRPIEPYVDLLVQESARDLADPLRADRAEVDERLRLPPFVVEDVVGAAEMGGQLVRRHLRMGA